MITTQISRSGARPAGQLASARGRDVAIGLGVLLLAAVFLLFDAHPMPILLWDESRNIVNALEMDRSGYSLVTTYQGQADLWNTKPPLMIWLMVASVRIFGASEWALRLPGMLAFAGTLAIVMVFVRRVSGSIWTAALAVALLVISPAALGEHGARTADYESLLTFFVTGYLVLLFFALHRARASRMQLALIALCIVGAALTKSIAGVMPGIGVCVYLLRARRFPRLWDGWGYLVAGAAVVGAVATFFFLREADAPGYLAAVWYNDIGGRFAAALETDRKPVTFYLADLWAGYFAGTALLILAPFVLRRMPARSRAATIYGLSIILTFLVVISLAGSKLHHYILPVLPIMAIVAALAFRTIVSRSARALHGGTPRERLTGWLLLAAAILPLIPATQGAIARRYLVEPAYEGAASRRYGPLFERMALQPLRVTVIDPGFTKYGDTHYVAVLQAYRLLWQRRGVAIDWSIALDPAIRGIVASCKPEVVPTLLTQDRDIGGVTGCAAIVRR